MQVLYCNFIAVINPEIGTVQDLDEICSYCFVIDVSDIRNDDDDLNRDSVIYDTLLL
jgi:hypothetical protein